MGFFSGFAEGLSSAIDDIRHTVVEQAYFGQQTTGNIELPQVEAPTIEAPSSGMVDLTSPNADPSWGVSSAAIEAPASYQEMMQQDMGKIEPPAPQQDMGMER
jgi:hypothetical protein